MYINKLLQQMRTSGKDTDFAKLEFGNDWGVLITPDVRSNGDRWNVIVLREGEPHYNNPIALGSELIGQNDDDVQDICIQIKELGTLEEVELGLDRVYFE